MKPIYLIDISSFIFRAFYAVRPLTSPAGVPTNAVYGVLSMLTKLISEENPKHIVVCYDRKEPSFRKEISEAYKANRAEMPEDLVPQMPIIKKIIDELGFPTLEVPGYEADDIMGTLSHLARTKFHLPVYIVSGDKDFAQVVRDEVYLVDTMKGTKMGVNEVKDKWGVTPEQFIDYLAIVGDTSDNVTGVPGIGPKGAVQLLTDYGSLDGIYENLEKIKSESVKKKLLAGKDSAYLAKKLVTIVHNVPISENLSDYELRPMKIDALRAHLLELNFKSFEANILKKMEPGVNASSSIDAKAKVATNAEVGSAHEVLVQHSEDVLDAISLAELKEKFAENSELWFWMGAQGLAVGGVESSGKTHFYMIQDEPSLLAKLAFEKKWRWCGHDVKTFWHGLKFPLGNVAGWDSMLAAYSFNPGDNNEFFRVYTMTTGKILPDLVGASQAMHAQVELRTLLTEKLHQDHGWSVYHDLELPLIPVLYDMEARGICLDSELLTTEGKELGKEIQELEKTIQKMADSEFNVASPKQLAQILFDKLKLTVHKKTKTGFSTDNEVLEKLKAEHPIAVEILKYRELAKLKSTYVDALPTMVKEDGRIHTTFNQAATATGRLSSTDPNLQNIPIKTERGSKVRRAFIGEGKKVLLSVDYSQIELRILAHYSEDKNLIKAFNDDLDIHAATAAEVFSVDVKEVTSDMRRTAKAVNFGIAYGQGVFGLAETLAIPRSEAQDIIKRYFARFPGVRDYIDSTIAIAKEKGFVETLLGRRRYMNELKSNNPMIRKFGERAAINAPIQGSASDIVKKAMIVVNEKSKLPMLLQVHDELIFEGSMNEVEHERAKIVHMMESVLALRVPLKANSAIGKNWEQAH